MRAFEGLNVSFKSPSRVRDRDGQLLKLLDPKSDLKRVFSLSCIFPIMRHFFVFREDGKMRHLFVERMIEDRFERSLSYFEFLQNLKQQMKS